jgi:hypothetical protein
MLNREKRKALESLVGADVANQLVTALQGREKSAQADGVSYKAMEPGSDELYDMIAGILGESEKSAVTEKCTPGTKDGKYMAKDTKAEDEEEAEEEEIEEDEEEGIESLLTADEIDMLADAVAKRLMSSMDEMKSKMDALDQEMKTRGYGRMKSSNDDQVLSTLKSYTESQEDFSEALVSILEEVNARLKSIEDHQKSEGHVASTSLANVLKSSDGRMANMSAQEAAAYNMWFQNQ